MTPRSAFQRRRHRQSRALQAGTGRIVAGFCPRAPQRGRSHRRAMAGFSLMEILVAVLIISLLAGIGTVTAMRMRGAGEERQTRVILQAALNASLEYQAQLGDTVEVDLSASDSSIKQFVREVIQVPEARQVLITLDQHLVWDDDDPESIRDAWDNPLEYREQVGDSGNDSLNLPAHHRPYFASAGPDGDFATTQDNLYSFDLD